jgi:hypothetical protein
MSFGDVLPEQTSDDLSDRDADDDSDDLRRFLDERPPHHLG